MNRRGFFGRLAAAFGAVTFGAAVTPRRYTYIKSRLHEADIPGQMAAYEQGLKRYLALQGGSWKASADYFWRGGFPGYVFEVAEEG